MRDPMRTVEVIQGALGAPARRALFVALRDEYVAQRQADTAGRAVQDAETAEWQGTTVNGA